MQGSASLEHQPGVIYGVLRHLESMQPISLSTDAPAQSVTFSKPERVQAHTKSARTERSLGQEAG